MGFSFYLAPIVIGVLLNQDKQVFGPFMVNRPLVAGFLVGLFLGAPQYGIWLGLSMELLWLATMPLGGQIIPNAGLAVSTVLSAWAASDFYLSDTLPSKEAGLVLAFIISPFWAKVFTVIDVFCRKLASQASAKAKEEILMGRDPQFFKLNFIGFLTNFYCSFAASLTGFIITWMFLNQAHTLTPAFFFSRIGFLFHFVPFVGLLMMAVSLPRRSLPYYIAGLMASLLAISAV